LIDIDRIRSKHEEPFPWEERVRIMAAVERLSEVQRKIIHGLFYVGKSQAEVGRELGLSQRQVSRAKEAILRELKGLLGAIEAGVDQEGQRERKRKRRPST